MLRLILIELNCFSFLNPSLILFFFFLIQLLNLYKYQTTNTQSYLTTCNETSHFTPDWDQMLCFWLKASLTEQRAGWDCVLIVIPSKHLTINISQGYNDRFSKLHFIVHYQRFLLLRGENLKTKTSVLQLMLYLWFWNGHIIVNPCITLQYYV